MSFKCLDAFLSQTRLHSDYTGFYVGILLCALLAALLIILNLSLGCCSPWKKYWNSSNSGNRHGLLCAFAFGLF